MEREATATDPREAEALLARYRGFEECLLTETRLTSFGTTLELDFSYIWEDANPDAWRLAESPVSVRLRLEIVRQVRIDTGIPPLVVEQPELAGWGLTEVAVVRLVPTFAWLTSGDDKVPLCLEVASDSPMKVEAAFMRLRIIDPRQP